MVIDTLLLSLLLFQTQQRRNGEYPIKGIDTKCHNATHQVKIFVEMESTRLRELTLALFLALFPALFRRNGEYPIKGIDTILRCIDSLRQCL